VAPQDVDGGEDQTVDEGDLVSLTGTFSDPGSADTHTYLWSVVASNGQLIANGTDSTFSFTPNDNGTYDVTFTVTDDDLGANSDTFTVTAENVAPTVESATPTPASIPGNFNTMVSGSFSDPSPVDSHTGSVNWGDGSPTQAITINPVTRTYTTPSHTYVNSTSSSVTYTGTITITDDDGGIGTKTFTVTVHPNAAFSNGTFVTNSAFRLQNDLSSWSVDEFEILKQKDYTIVATNPGQFYEHVRVTNSTGASQTVGINASWPTDPNKLKSFVTQGANPIHCYQQLAGSSTWNEVACTKTINATTGTAAISIAGVPNGASVWVTIHLDYAGKGVKDSAMIVRTFTFSSTWTVGPMAGGDTTTIVGRPKKVTMVYGTVTDTSGNPLGGASVTLNQSGLKATYKTGADGFYVFFDGMSCITDLGAGGSCASPTAATLPVPGGSYSVGATATGYNSVSLSADVSTGAAIRRDPNLTLLP
jgi:hypothetical protein